MCATSPVFSLLFFFSSRTRHTRWPRDWSSDVCSSDLGPPVGAIADVVAKQAFHQTRLLAGLHPEDGQGLDGALVQPAGGQLGVSGNAYRGPGGIGQIDNVGDHAVGIAPLGFATGALEVVAQLRPDDAGVAAGQGAKAGVAIPLVEALAALAAAVNAMDGAAKLQPHLLAEKRVEGHAFLAQGQRIASRFSGRHRHLAQGAAVDESRHQLIHRSGLSAGSGSLHSSPSTLWPRSM